MGGILRRLGSGDIEGVVTAYRVAWGEARPISASEIRAWLDHPAIDPDALRVLEVGGKVVGYGDITISDGVVALEVAAENHWGVFLAWAESVARLSNASRVRVLSYSGENLANAAAERGYFLWRSNYTMEIDLDPTKSVVPPIPDGFVLRPYKTSDEPELLGAINQVFDPDPFYSVMTLEHFRASFVRDPGKTADALWQLLWSGHDLVAFSLGFSEHHGDREVGEIRSVGVREAWRRRGLGEIVVRACFRALHERGLRRVTLGVDASNPTGAVQFYESLGMHVAARGDNWAIDLP